MTSESEELQQLIQQSIHAGMLRRVVLSRPRSRSAEVPRRVDVRPVTVGGKLLFQFTRQIGTQHFHANLNDTETVSELHRLAGAVYRDCMIREGSSEWTAHFSKKGKCRLLQQGAPDSPAPAIHEHNRQRQYLIPDDSPVPFLVETGIMSPAGKVKAKQYAKFRQINRYAEFISDILPKLPSEGALRIVDFGSGKSYLTFAMHYLLTETANRTVNITGLDRRADVIEQCRTIAEKLDLRGIEFETGDIADFEPTEPVQLAVSLHACDMATDDAIAAAVLWQADVILAVPCCHHELASRLSRDSTPLISRHGITHERFAELATDSVRAAMLECVGYRTDIVEFIDLEHTARNVLIRASRREHSDRESLRRHYEELHQFCTRFDIPPLRLQRKLQEYGLLRSDLHTDSDENA